jgi:hypothetical protein
VPPDVLLLVTVVLWSFNFTVVHFSYGTTRKSFIQAVLLLASP